MRKPKLEVDAPKKKRILVQEGPVFNEYNKQSMYAHLRKGLHYKTAAGLTGVSERTANGWYQQGKKDQEDFELEFLDYQTEKAVYYTQCNIAKSEFIAKGVEKIANSEDWRGTQWLLITNEEGYRPPQKVDINKTNTNKIVFEVVDSATWKKDLVEDGVEVPLINDADTFEGEYVEEAE